MTATQVLFATVPVRLVSVANAREPWQARHRRAKAHRAAAKAALGPDIKGPPPPYVITITRIGPRQLDSDNLAGSAKALRDGVADWLGIDDGSPRIKWEYAQHKGDAGHYSAWVRVQWTAGPGVMPSNDRVKRGDPVPRGDSA